jgi:hypothetical protein
MGGVSVLRGFQVKVLMAQSGEAMGWARAICHCKCNRVIKINNQLVLDVANFGAIIDVMLAIPTSLCD